MIENPRTGERIDFLVRTPELLAMHVTWPRPGHRALEHIHPEMEESFTVLAGRAAFRIGGDGGHELEADAGDTVIIEPGTRHLAWNPTGGPVELRIEMRPGLRWGEFTERFFAGEDPVGLLDEFRREVVFPED